MGQFDDERTVELKAQLNSAFAQRAGKPGYGADGWKTPGLDNQATRDEGRRMEQNQKQVMRVAQRNAVKALRSGNAEAWQFWSNQAGGKTFGINDAEQRSDTAALGADRNAQNAFRLNDGVTANPNAQAGAGNGTPVNDKRAAQEAAGAIEQAAAGQSATAPATTSASPSGAPANAIPDRKEGEGNFAYAERLAQMRGKQQGVYGGQVRENTSKPNARQAFANELDNSDLIKSGDVKALQSAFNRGESLGVSKKQVLSYLNRDIDSVQINHGEAETPATPSKAIAAADPVKEHPFIVGGLPATQEHKDFLKKQTEARDSFNQTWNKPAEKDVVAPGKQSSGEKSFSQALSEDVAAISKAGSFMDDVFIGAGDTLLGAPRKILANYYGGLASVPAMPTQALPGATGDYFRKQKTPNKVFAAVRDFIGGYEENKKPGAPL